MGVALNVRHLWIDERLWRFVDALAPRGFGFVMHSWLIWRFGAEAYALPAWVIVTFGLAVSFIPDPSGYVLLARNPERARGRARLFSSWLWGKILLGASATLLGVILFAEPLLAATEQEGVVWIVLGGLAFALTETVWSACSTNRFAAETLVSWAQLGIVLRVIALAAAMALDSLFSIGIGPVLLIFSVPLLLACLIALPLPVLNRRSRIAGLFALRRYSLWTQANGFLLAFMAQAPIFFAGTISTLAPATTGQLAYVIRIMNFLVQPLMILQSVIIRDYSRSGVDRSHAFRLYRLSYRGVGVLIFSVTLVMAWLTPDITLVLYMIGSGFAIFTAFRFEFALLNALRDVRFLSFYVFLPVTFIFAVLVTFLRDTLIGVAFAVAIGHLILTFLLAFQARRRIVFEDRLG
jgi:O-antigen/teichoic acid export membrane protein